MTYSIWLEPSSRDGAYLKEMINGLAKAYNAPKFPPHITVYSGTRNLDTAKDAVKECRKFKKFSSLTAGIKSSDYLWKTMYIEIRQDANLVAIHGMLADSLKTKYLFRPHLSLMYKKMPSGTRAKIRRSITVKKSIEFDRITIITSSSRVSDWRRAFSIRLG